MGTSDEAQNQGEINEQTVLYNSANKTVTTPLKTETSSQAQEQDESNGQSLNETVTTPLMN